MAKKVANHKAALSGKREEKEKNENKLTVK